MIRNKYASKWNRNSSPFALIGLRFLTVLLTDDTKHSKEDTAALMEE